MARFPTVQYGISAGTFSRLPVEDQNQVLREAGISEPLVGGYAPPPSSGSDSSRGDTTGGGTSTTATPLDWHAYLMDWGFTSDIVNELDRIFRTYSNSNDASAAALAYIRGTDWYTQTFPGIQEGMKLGVIGNEQDYRAYTNQLNDIYQRYYGRSVTGQEVAGALNSGYNPEHVNRSLAGQAYINANQSDIQYELGAFDPSGRLTQDQLTQYGQYHAGLDNMLGPELDRRLALARQKMQTIFQGVLAKPSLSLTNTGRLTAPGLSATPDIGA